MSDNVIRLLPADEEAILACYITGSKELASFQQLYDALGVPDADTIARACTHKSTTVQQSLIDVRVGPTSGAKADIS